MVFAKNLGFGVGFGYRNNTSFRSACKGDRTGCKVLLITEGPAGRLVELPPQTESHERKGKERMYLYSAFIVATTLKALRRGSHSFACK